MPEGTFTIKATNEYGLSGEGGVGFDFAGPPVITNIAVDNVTTPSPTRTIYIEATDPQDSELTYTMRKENGAIVPLTPVEGQAGVFTVQVADLN